MGSTAMPCSSRLASTRFAFVQPGNWSAFVPVSRLFHAGLARVVRSAGEAGGQLVERGDERRRLVFESLSRAGIVEVVRGLVDEVRGVFHPLHEVLERALADGDLREGEVHAVPRRDDGLRVVLLGDF